MLMPKSPKEGAQKCSKRESKLPSKKKTKRSKVLNQDIMSATIATPE
jgi:hypothetical protein